MKQQLTGWERRKAIIAQWIVIRVAMRLSPLSVLALCLDISRKYYESMDVEEE
jgi:hypothetical protein